MNPTQENGEARAAESLTKILGSIYGVVPEPAPDIWERIASYARRTWILTDAQTTVALESLKGFSNQEIAKRLQISHETVNKHLDAVLKKADVHSRGQLAAIVLEVANLI